MAIVCVLTRTGLRIRTQLRLGFSHLLMFPTTQKGHERPSIHRILGTAVYETPCFVLRIARAMRVMLPDVREKLEADETYIGGKDRIALEQESSQSAAQRGEVSSETSFGSCGPALCAIALQGMYVCRVIGAQDATTLVPIRAPQVCTR